MELIQNALPPDRVDHFGVVIVALVLVMVAMKLIIPFSKQSELRDKVHGWFPWGKAH